MDKDRNADPLKNSTIALMVCTALFLDLLQWLLAFLFLDWVVGFFAGLTFFVWFSFYGISFLTPKRIAAGAGAFIIEIIPILATLPAWTGAVIIIVLDHRAKRFLANKTPAGKVLTGKFGQQRKESEDKQTRRAA